MTIRNRIEVPYPQEFRDEISKMLGYQGYRQSRTTSRRWPPNGWNPLTNLVDYRWDSRILWDEHRRTGRGSSARQMRNYAVKGLYLTRRWEWGHYRNIRRVANWKYKDLESESQYHCGLASLCLLLGFLGMPACTQGTVPPSPRCCNC